MKSYYIVLVRPVGSHCWTVETIAVTAGGANKRAAECRNAKIRFADGSVHIQSTCIVHVTLPAEPDKTQQHYDQGLTGTVMMCLA